MRRLIPLLAMIVLLPACGLIPRGMDPDVEIARRAVVQIEANRFGETYDALAPDLAERFRWIAERLPDPDRERTVEIISASVVWKGKGFAEVAVVSRVSPNPARLDASPFIARHFVRVQDGKAVAVYPAPTRVP